MNDSLTLNKYVFGTYHVPLWMPGTQQLRMADNRVIIATLLALCHSTQKTGKIIIQIHLQYKLLCYMLSFVIYMFVIIYIICYHMLYMLYVIIYQ